MTLRLSRIALSLALSSLAIAAAGCRGVRLQGTGTPGPVGPVGAVAAAPKADAKKADEKKADAPKPAPASRPVLVSATRRVGDYDAVDLPLERVLAEARRLNRPVAIFFSTSWCGWCRRLERDTLPDAAVRAELAHWYVVKYDADKGAGRAAAERYGVDGFPTTVFLDSAGQHAGQAAGYSDAPHFAAKLRAARH
jgi:thiol:disulfide interchange protein